MIPTLRYELRRDKSKLDESDVSKLTATTIEGAKEIKLDRVISLIAELLRDELTDDNTKPTENI